jgi:hypothetical protein
MPPTKTTLVVRPKPAAAPLSPNFEVDAYGLFFKIADNHGRLRNRVDSLESRIKYLEALLEDRSSR